MRYIGRKFNLYPEDAQKAYEVDSLLNSFEDLTTTMFGIFMEKDEEVKKEKVGKFLTEGLPKTLGFYEARLKEKGGKFFTGDSVTIADVYLGAFMSSYFFNEKAESTPMLKPVVT